ncbi:calmodulin-binding protein 60 A-like isoform X1 [Salvia divinorum]|uniref:Calmodulin-binding protein 60 A-like isoform X1 n=1 Tax=Salvia divinorum TaxID=28513 RepID=A0ABD1ICT6_SALDI
MDDDQYMKIFEEELDLEKERTLATVAEGFESAKRRMSTRFKRHLIDGSAGITTMRLEFRNGIAREILTGEEIRGEGDVPIEVALVDDVTGDVVVDEPEASAKIELYLLNAEELVVPQEEGKRPVLAGSVSLHLHRGVAVVANIKIRHCAATIKPPVFRLGARVVGASARVKEAKTEAFALKDFRIKYFKKHENPSLSDDVSRLVWIRRGGKIDKRLHDNKIDTVEDFLIRLLRDPQSLKSIVKTQAKKWKAIVNNARACLSSERVYCYIDPKQKTGVVFNILGRVDDAAEKLLASAYQNWNEVKAFDDQNSLQQHLEERTEMAGGSTSGTNSCGGDAAAGYTDDQVDGIYHAVMQCLCAYPCSPPFEGLVSGSNGGEPRIVVGSSNSPRMWRKVLCVSKWLSLRRRVSPTPKKQRII